ncbi:MAG: carbon monoxide dehydrogenase subunit G [Chloroflexi bacterium]|nr:carbon monoxide dehydrogenase subunit G [Chloroflexota bacterium]
MIVQGEFEFRGPRETVWQLLMDPAVLIKAMPGARTLERVEENRYEGVMRVGVGPVTAAEWSVQVDLQDLQRPESYGMHIESKGPLGFTRGNARVTLTETGPLSTAMLYHADLQVGGRVASVGQRLLDQVAKMLTKHGLDALSRELESRLREEGPAASPTHDEAP